MFNASIQTIAQLKTVLTEISCACYVQPCKTLSNASIGQHTRHIIELYQCLLNGYQNANVSYDERDRNINIEEKRHFAIEKLEDIQQKLEKPDKILNMTYILNGQKNILASNYYREVMYNLEHTIHHQALIKVGLDEVACLCIPENFGVAPSTIEYKKKCVQ